MIPIMQAVLEELESVHAMKIENCSQTFELSS